MSGIEVITTGDLHSHPRCPHGPTLLFSRGKSRNFFACSAFRDQKLCPFFQWENEKQKSFHGVELPKFPLKTHRKLVEKLKLISTKKDSGRFYCFTCNKLGLNLGKHESHEVITNLTNEQLRKPSSWLRPLDQPKKEAQFFFTKSTVQFLCNLIEELQFERVVCLGTPRLHEALMDQKVSSILLDLDFRYHQFFGPKSFCWYNQFNDHFFEEHGRSSFDNFMESANKNKVLLVMDPPFGGRVEPLMHVLGLISKKYNFKGFVQFLWIFPYFMEAHLKNNFPQIEMLDYKVNYDNHGAFREEKGRKFGSPIRIFTNLDVKKIRLPIKEGYKYCNDCSKWVSQENSHCKLCKNCTSKDGRTYVHCKQCKKCVKPSWNHCTSCQRCAQKDHKCEELSFEKNCFHCHQPGHKKRDCFATNTSTRKKIKRRF